jgi:RNA polymerase sigma factor (TIGR02999 family)
MNIPDPASMTELLNRMAAGDADASARLLPVLYDELHTLAEREMRQPAATPTLQPTALIHEAWMRLVGGSPAHFANRTHFASVAARAMRSVLVDHVRRRQAEKRGGASARVQLDDVVELLAERAPHLLELDVALERLTQMDAQLGRLVELRFFGGLSVEETARVLGVSEPTVSRGWRVARMWLRNELEQTAGE